VASTGPSGPTTIIDREYDFRATAYSAARPARPVHPCAPPVEWYIFATIDRTASGTDLVWPCVCLWSGKWLRISGGQALIKLTKRPSQKGSADRYLSNKALQSISAYTYGTLRARLSVRHPAIAKNPSVRHFGDDAEEASLSAARRTPPNMRHKCSAAR